MRKKLLWMPLLGVIIGGALILGYTLQERVIDTAQAAGEYGTLLIDAFPDAGNTSDAFGTVDVCRDTEDDGASPLDVDDTFTVDVIIDGAPMIAGAGWLFNYNPAVLNVTAYNWSNWKFGPGGLNLTEAVPDTDGSHSAGYAGVPTSGDGVLMRLTLKVVGNGESDLTLTEAQVSDPFGTPYFEPDVLVSDPPGNVRVVVGGSCPVDTDGDGVSDDEDNCPTVFNPDQENTDSTADPPGDSLGDACDNCPDHANEDQADNDNDDSGDICDPDDDNDGILDDGDNSDIEGDNPCSGGETIDCDDNCPLISNPDQADGDSNGIGDACETQDSDGDGVLDDVDNCPDDYNPDQTDTDGDGVGDVCDVDTDNDSCIPPDYVDCLGPSGGFFRDDVELFVGTDPLDACADTPEPNDERGPAFTEPRSPWPPDFNDTGDVEIGDLVALKNHWPPLGGTYDARYDLNADGSINIADLVAFKYYWHTSCPDWDGDRVPNDSDNCPLVANPGQEDNDGDGFGDACDDDDDNDTILDVSDNCPLVANPSQEDNDGDGLGDACDVCPDDVTNDSDDDGICAGDGYNAPKTGDNDNCPAVANPDQTDTDADGLGNACDPLSDHDDSVDPADTEYAVTIFGPAPVQIGDTLGRFMWVTGYVKNLTSHDDVVKMTLSIDGLPTGCIANQHHVPQVPPTDIFRLNAGETKPIIYQARFECQEPAVGGEYDITVTFSVDHLAHPAYPDDPEVGDEFDAPGPSGTNAIANNSVSQPVTLTVAP